MGSRPRPPGRLLHAYVGRRLVCDYPVVAPACCVSRVSAVQLAARDDAVCQQVDGAGSFASVSTFYDV